ncbi:hypothetical protein IOK49_02235 [Fervidicoccus fontis]|uniref:DHHA1 domain-containing protein n=1 Tax=Fervidicoccus fontis TaxID=683846 RepID=A0A843AHD8_9CREN|nr:DHHA1 domain-containing protein [Fervidicoccus fontis]MBE9390900.1 hypothetical protein [Fervidicoccus fontis]
MRNVKLISITHTDLDGVGSSSLYIRNTKPESYKVIFVEPYQLLKAVKSIAKSDESFDELVITDIGPNASTIKEVERALEKISREKGARIRWFDHHIWNNEWKDDLIKQGVDLRVDENHCATEVVYRNLNTDDIFSYMLSKSVCSADLWIFNDWAAPFLVRFVGNGRGKKWLEYVHSIFVKSPSFETLIEASKNKAVEVFDREIELMGFYREKAEDINIEGIKLTFVFKSHNDLSTSMLAQYLMSVRNSDIVVVVDKRGKYEFRSKKCNVREIAFKLGGGGHPEASGAPFPSFLTLLMKMKLYGLAIDLAKKKFLNTVKEVSCIPFNVIKKEI